MAIEFESKIRKALEGPQYWHLGTVNPDGSPQVTTVWLDLRGDKILVNSALGRKKPRNLEQEPRVALSWSDPENHHHSIAIQGRVVDSYAGERADDDINSLAKKYIGQDVYPWRKPGEQRISYVIEPTHIFHLNP